MSAIKRQYNNPTANNSVLDKEALNMGDFFKNQQEEDTTEEKKDLVEDEKNEADPIQANPAIMHFRSNKHPLNIYKNEVFDQDKAFHILNRASEYAELLNNDSENGEDTAKDKLKLLDNYLKASKKGAVDVQYSQKEHGLGRYFANHGISLANMGKKIRHTIAADYYDDLDIINAHPVILKYICDMLNDEECPCVELTKFINNRDKYYSMLGVDRDTAKKIYLIIINKHEIELSELKKLYKGLIITSEFRKLINELFQIRESLPNIFKKTAASYRKYKENKAKEAGDELYNFEGSFINILMCDIENDILQCIIEFFNNPADCVLCFDGVMLRKSLNAEQKINECEQYIYKKIGINIKLAIKPMDKGFIIDNPDKYEEAIITPKDKYVFGDFRKYYKSKTFNSYNELISQFSRDANRVFARILEGDGFYIKKDNTEDYLYNKIKKISSIVDFDIKYYKQVEEKKSKTILRKIPGKTTEDPEIKNVEVTVSMSDLLDTVINDYYVIACKPEGASINEFNIWQGFRGSLVENLDMNIINPMLNFINDTWAGGDKDLYEYLLSWLALTVQKAGSPIGAALFVYGAQGTGKNTLTDFLIEYVLGHPVSCVSNDINSIVQKHNSIIEGKKLMILNELGSTKDEFLNNFNKMKHLITEKTLTIEPKGINSYKINNLSNFILVSNHKDAIYIEDDDRRYCCIEISNCHANDRAYFKDLREKCFNQTCGDHFYTYLMNYKYIDVCVVPNTQLKRDIAAMSKPSWKKFLEAVKDNLNDYNSMSEEEQIENDIRMFRDKTVIKSIDFYNKYVNWCQENGERSIINNNKFAIVTKNNIQKKRSNGTNYDILTIN